MLLISLGRAGLAERAQERAAYLSSPDRMKTVGELVEVGDVDTRRQRCALRRVLALGGAGDAVPIQQQWVVVMFGPPQMIPDQRPDLTPGGRPTLRKRSKTDRNALYAAALGSPFSQRSRKPSLSRRASMRSAYSSSPRIPRR